MHEAILVCRPHLFNFVWCLVSSFELNNSHFLQISDIFYCYFFGLLPLFHWPFKKNFPVKNPFWIIRSFIFSVIILSSFMSPLDFGRKSCYLIVGSGLHCILKSNNHIFCDILDKNSLSWFQSFLLTLHHITEVCNLWGVPPISWRRSFRMDLFRTIIFVHVSISNN